MAPNQQEGSPVIVSSHHYLVAYFYCLLFEYVVVHGKQSPNRRGEECDERKRCWPQMWPSLTTRRAFVRAIKRDKKIALLIVISSNCSMCALLFLFNVTGSLLISISGQLARQVSCQLYNLPTLHCHGMQCGHQQQQPLSCMSSMSPKAPTTQQLSNAVSVAAGSSRALSSIWLYLVLIREEHSLV